MLRNAEGLIFYGHFSLSLSRPAGGTRDTGLRT